LGQVKLDNPLSQIAGHPPTFIFGIKTLVSIIPYLTLTLDFVFILPDV
tara:strand:+ start:155 stop:298 length:144 start_codon:yes stop_codon:yes gene_type:complete